MIKRCFERVDIDEPVGVHVGDNYKVEKGRQISEGGMLFETIREFVQGQSVTFTFQLSDTELLSIEGKVSYVIKPMLGLKLVGVRFNDSSPEVMRGLFDYFYKKFSK